MRRLTILLAVILAALAVYAAPASATFLTEQGYPATYHAADDAHRIFYRYPGTWVGTVWATYTNNARDQWNEERAATGNTNFASMSRTTDSILATSKTRFMTADEAAANTNVLAFFRHNDGPTLDEVVLNKGLLNNYPPQNIRRTIMHEWGHGHIFGHPNDDPDATCLNTVMLQTGVCGVYSTSNVIAVTPGAYDRTEAARVPSLPSDDDGPVTTAADAPRDVGHYPEFVDLPNGERFKASETVVTPDSVTIYEYAPPAPFAP